MFESQNKDERTGTDEPPIGLGTADKKNYTVGRGRPPKETRWKKGQSGNPSGRPKNRQNLKTELKGIANKRINVRDGEAEQKLSLIGANLLTHGVRGAKGDVQSSKLFLSVSEKYGLLDEQNSSGLVGGSAALPSPSNSSHQSEALFANLNLDLLSEDEKIELARFGHVIDLGGDFTALSERDFERAKKIANKARGRNVTLQG